MNLFRSDRAVLSLAIVISLFIHVAVLLPALVAAASTEGSMTDLEHELQDDVPPEEQEPLGIDDSTESTMTWIGYDTYQEHLAELAEFDQAEFVNASSPTQSMNQGEQPAPRPGRPAQEGAPPTTTPKRTPPAGGGAPIDGLGEQSGGQPSTGQGPLSSAKPGAATKPSTNPSPSKDAEPSDSTDQSDTPQPKDAPKETPKPQKPGEAPDSGGGGAPANPSDEPTPPEPNASKKESDATSTISVPRENWISGRPLASQGLELTPKKPVLTSLQSLSGAANMLVVIRFSSSGKPKEAEILQPSGSPGIDTAVLASLYRWRAKGERLKELSETGTIDVQLELIMSRKRR